MQWSRVRGYSVQMSALLWAGVAAAQGSPPVVVNGKAASEARATLAPLGTLEVDASVEGEPVAWRVHFPPLEPLEAGGYDITAQGPLRLERKQGEAWVPVAHGTLQVTSWMPEKIAATLSLGEGDRAIQVTLDLPATVAPLPAAEVTDARDVAGFPAPLDQPKPEDLVFCAVGNTGTGLPGASAVAEQIADLAATGPLDFVLLLGDTFAPRGVADVNDAQWKTKFEKLFDQKRLPVPFYATLGAAEHQGSVQALIDYGKFTPRWVMPAFTYSFEVDSHGKKVLFVALDTEAMIGLMSDPRTRTSMRIPTQKLWDSKADWKIVYGYTPMFSRDAVSSRERASQLRQRFAEAIDPYGVDVFIAGDDRVTEVFGPRRGMLHVTAGGGGGPEVAAPLRWAVDTRCGFTGGGFAWFRFNGEMLEISLRDITGAVRYVHHLRK